MLQATPEAVNNGQKFMESSEDLVTAQRLENGWRLHVLIVAATGTTRKGRLNAFARALDESANNIGHILAGRSSISERILRKCKAKYRGLTIDWLLTGDPNKLSPDMLRKLWRAEIQLVVDGYPPPERLVAEPYHKRVNSVPHLGYDNLPQDT